MCVYTRGWLCVIISCVLWKQPLIQLNTHAIVGSQTSLHNVYILVLTRYTHTHTHTDLDAPTITRFEAESSTVLILQWDVSNITHVHIHTHLHTHTHTHTHMYEYLYHISHVSVPFALLISITCLRKVMNFSHS